MANELVKVFENDQFGKIRTIVKGNEPWFVAADVCKALEISNPRMATDRLDTDEKNTVSLTDGNRGNPNMTIVNEPGLYTLVLGSRKPEAKLFKRWITHEVIPAIRKTGGYILGEESMSDEELLSRAIIVAQKKIEEKDKRIIELESENKNLLAENEAFVKKTLEWDARPAINKIIRKCAKAYCGDYSTCCALAWTEYFDRLLYKRGIALKQRVAMAKGRKEFKGTLNCLKDTELADALSVAVAMAKELDIEVAGIINKCKLDDDAA